LNLSRILRHRLFAATVLTAISFYVYEPAVHRVFVADQIWYFAELHGSTSLSSGLAHYDYAYSRKYWKGDDALFRPIALIWLAVGNTLFSYHHVLWNLATLVLHILVTISLFNLLLEIQPTAFALPFVSLFAVMTPALELVLWNHLGGYLLAYLFLTIALQRFVRMTVSGSTSAPDIAVYTLSFTAAVFAHESLVLICLIASLIACVAWQRRRLLTTVRVLAVVLPLVLFAAFYLFHIRRVERIGYVDRGDGASILDVHNMTAMPVRSLRVIRQWGLEVALPSAIVYRVVPFERLVSRLEYSWRMPHVVLCVTVGLLALVLFLRSLSFLHTSRRWPVVAVLASAVLAHIAVIAMGRGDYEIFTTMYYRYFFCLILVALAYAMVDFDQVRREIASVAGVILIVLFLVHATSTHAVAREIRQVNQRPSDYVTRIANFVEDHKREAEFSFAMENPPTDVDPEIVLIEGYPDKPLGPERRMRVSEILFARYYRAQNPKYVLGSDGSVRTR
jgi:hypothetical protein